MWGRNRISLSREGLYYVGVVLFIIGGAVLRDRNLLIVLAGMMIGPMVFNWRLVVLSLRRLRVERRVPERTTAGVPVTIEVIAENQRSRLSSWAVQVQDSIVCEAENGASSTATEVLFPRIAPGQTVTQSYRCTLTRRGRYAFGPLIAATRFPLGLIHAANVVPAADQLIVCPHIGRLTPLWHQLMAGVSHGSQRTDRRRGFTEGDYYGLREWQAGDSRRWIHWRTSARMGGLAVKQFERRRSRDVAVLIDLFEEAENSSLQRASSPSPPAVGGEALPDHPEAGQVAAESSMAATVVVDLCQRIDSRVTIALAGERSRSWICQPASRILAEEVLDELATATSGDGTSLATAFAQAWQDIRPEMDIVVISSRSQPDALPQEPGGGGLRARTVLWVNASDPLAQRYYQLS